MNVSNHLVPKILLVFFGIYDSLLSCNHVKTIVEKKNKIEIANLVK